MNKFVAAVTGSTGFIGQHLLHELMQRGITFRTFDKDKHNLLRPESLEGFLSGVDAVVHLAGSNRDTNVQLIKTNVLATVGLLDAMVMFAPSAKIIFSSTFQVYVEDSLYGLSKRHAEEYIEFYTRSTRLTGIILRFSNIYGPGCRPYYNSVIATFADFIQKGLPLRVNGDGTQKRDYLHVSDAAAAIVHSFSGKQKHKIEYFDICSGVQTSLVEIIRLLQVLSGKHVPVEYNMVLEGRAWDIVKTYNKAALLLDWYPHIGLQDGLLSVVKS